MVDGSVPIGKLVRRLVGDLIDPEEKVDWHVLAMIWERLEGRVPERLEAELNIRGVIALPVLRASEMDWSADAVAALTGHSERPALTLPPTSVRTEPEPSSDQDD